MAVRVHHPNLLQFIGATLLGELIVLTELMPTSLRAVLGEADLSQQLIISISLDVARALNYLHLMKPNAIIHRDISSATVLLDPAPNNNCTFENNTSSALMILEEKTQHNDYESRSEPNVYFSIVVYDSIFHNNLLLNYLSEQAVDKQLSAVMFAGARLSTKHLQRYQ